MGKRQQGSSRIAGPHDRTGLWLVMSLSVILGGCVTPFVETSVTTVTVTPSVGALSGLPPASVPLGRRIAYQGDGIFVLPDGSSATADASGGFTLPNGAYASPDAAGGVILPNGSRCGPDGVGGYICP